MKTHTLIIRAQNSDGVLGKITNLLRRRMFNIEGLTAGTTDQKGISQITVSFSGAGENKLNAEQAKKQLSKIIEILTVRDADENTISRELGLFRLHASEKNKPAIFDAVKVCGGKIIASGKKSVVVEVCGSADEIENFLEIAKTFGIQEFARSSGTAIKRI